MEKRLLDLSRAPDDPIERIVWLDGVMEQVRDELDEAFSEAYFWARFTGRLDAALALKRQAGDGLHPGDEQPEGSPDQVERRAFLIVGSAAGEPDAAL
jgi:hypothetical protein